MPELAEVEYVVRQMRTTIIGAEIAQVAIPWARAITHPSAAEFATALVGRTIERIDRRAKLMLLFLSAEGVVTVHRRMSGNLFLREVDEPDEPYLCVDFTLADGRHLQYTDPRKFGRLALWSVAELPAVLAQFGVEPLGADFTIARLTQIVQRHDRALKPLLLDQAQIAGLGNIYTDEALLLARLHPLRSASSLTDAEIARLHAAIIAVLELGIAHGGTSFGRHQDLFGNAGRNFDHLKAYQQEGKPCPTCGTLIQRLVVTQRGTRICPTCQVLPL